MIKTASTAWKTSLRTGSLADRDYRLYADFRQKEYPDLGTGSAQYTVVREDNLFDRGNCSSPIPPMIFDETVPVLRNTTSVRSSVQAHTGDYSYLCTKTVAPVASAHVFFTDSYSAGDMHGLIPGVTYTLSCWVYSPSSGGAPLNELRIGFESAEGWISELTLSGSHDVFNNYTLTETIPVDATSAFFYLYFAGTTASGEFCYIDDLKLTSHTVPGSHALTGGYAEYLLPLPDTFNFEIKAKANFAYNVASDQPLFGWYLDATHYLKYHYNATTDKYELEWKDGGTARILTSSAYTVTCLLDAWIIHSFALDFTTGDTTGSQMWIDKATTDLFWSDASDVKSSVFNKMQVRAFNGTAGNHDIAYARFFDATAEQEIEANLVGYWPLNEGAGTVAADNSGYGNHGTLQNGAAWIDGVAGKALNLPVGNDHVSLANPITTTGDKTFTAWVYIASGDAPPAATNYDILASEVYPTSGFLWRAMSNGGLRQTYRQNRAAGTQTVAASVVTPTDAWAFLSLVVDSGTARFYINAVLAGAVAIPDNDANAGSTYIGSPFQSIKGYVDEIRSYNTAKSISFLETLYNDTVIAHTGSIATDFKSTKDEEVFFDFNGHGTGRTRCNISTPASRTLTKYDLYKGITSRLNASYGTNTLNCTLRNDDGRFSDDQNAAWDPANSVYNGTNAQNYLQQRFGVELESWYSNDFDTVFLGRSVEGGLSRTSKMKTVSTVNLSAEDGVGDLDRSFEENGRVFPSSMLVRSDTLIDRGGCESTTAPSMLGETSATLSNATFARSTGQVYHGRYSYLLTKTIAAGTAATVTLADSVAGGDTHGMTASATYTLSMKVYIPSGAMLGSEFVIALVDSVGSGTQAATNVYDSWQHVSVSRGGHAFTYAYPQIQIAAAAAINETVYIDDIKLVPDDLSEATDNSLFHKIAKRGYRKTIQYLSNNSFENADITLSWLVSTGGTLNRDAADGFFGSVSGELIPGAAEEYAYQQVTFLLTQ
jgi:hypothetical protein